MTRTPLLIAATSAGLALLLAAIPVYADDPPAVGTQTRAWTKMQAGGAAAEKGPPRGMPGEVADRVYQRYLQSFTHPIPEQFERERIGGEASK
jgi:hypothetical protein